MYEPQNPQLARERTGKGAWYMTPVAPLKEITIETMKKLTATMEMDSRHVSPIAMIDEANCQVAALKASEIQ